METLESNNDKMYRAKFWRMYVYALIVAIITSTIIGITTSSIWIGIVSYFLINSLLSFGVFYKFYIDSVKL